MNDKQQQLWEAVKDFTASETLAFLAIGYSIIGYHPGNVGTHSKGVYKRAIKCIRAVQPAFPEHEADFERAVLFIRKEWLRKED